MKKILRILCLALCVIMAVSVCACGPSEKKGSVETIKIGLAFPMSGMAAMAGKYSTHGADVLKEELGGKITVGDKEYPIEFVVMDTEGSEEKTANVYQKLIEEEKVIAIAGPDSSKCMLAAAPIAQNAKCPAITSFGTNTAVTEVGDYIFRACFIDPFQGAVAAAYCDGQGHKTACIMFNNADAYSVGLKDAFVENYNGEVLAIEEYSGSDVKDYNVQLTKLAAQNPDVLLLPNLNVELGLQIQQARTAGLNCQIVCGDSADTPDVAKVAGPAIEGVAYVSAFSAESTDEAAKKFVDAYVELHPDELPNSNAELTYEAVKMIVWAIQNAKTLDRAGVRDALAAIDGLDLPSGKMTMDPETRNPIKGGIIMQYDADGITRYVSTVNP
ncbi:MAG: ABC transporter substrate-binding protein [Clostridiaceae bacterium]|jgi:branched-chain amino acid transport system substrate-binding protein|nr:ABC transporter substrate-binding protein [Clostridiaceae bacterium]